MFDLLDGVELPTAPHQIVLLCVLVGAGFCGLTVWFGSGAEYPVVLRVLAGLLGAAAGAVAGLVVGVVVVVTLIGGIAGLVVGVGARLGGEYAFGWTSDALFVAPVAVGAGIGAVVGLAAVAKVAAARMTAGRAAVTLAALAALAAGGYLTTDSVLILRAQTAEKKQREAADESARRQAARDRVRKAADEPVAVPAVLSADAGRRAYEAWHRADRLLREYRAVAGEAVASPAADEAELATIETLGQLAAGAGDPDATAGLTAVSDALVTVRQREPEPPVHRAEQAIDVGRMFAESARRESATKRGQERADAAGSALARRYGVEFARLPLRPPPPPDPSK